MGDKVGFVPDMHGTQGWVYFDGIYYWETAYDQATGRTEPVCLTCEEWAKRNELLRKARTRGGAS